MWAKSVPKCSFAAAAAAGVGVGVIVVGGETPKYAMDMDTHWHPLWQPNKHGPVERFFDGKEENPVWRWIIESSAEEVSSTIVAEMWFEMRRIDGFLLCDLRETSLL